MCVKPFGRIHTMARPNKLFKETMSYNLTIEKKDYDDRAKKLLDKRI